MARYILGTVIIILTIALAVIAISFSTRQPETENPNWNITINQPEKTTETIEKPYIIEKIVTVDRPVIINENDIKDSAIDRIASKMGESGQPGWIPEDVNHDGTIDVLDMIPVGQFDLE